MNFILILYFMGTHAAFDLPDREACGKQAEAMVQMKLAMTGRPPNTGSYQFSYQCWPQSPAMIELASKMVTP